MEGCSTYSPDRPSLGRLDPTDSEVTPDGEGVGWVLVRCPSGPSFILLFNSWVLDSD